MPIVVRRFFGRAKSHDWFAVLIEFAIVVAGIVIGIQASLWVQARQDRQTEKQYLQRLLTDSNDNIGLLRDAIETNERRGGIFAQLSSAIKNRGPVPTGAQLSAIMCRWYVQPAVNIRHGTYDELVSSGRLALLRDESLRDLLAREQGAHAESQRLDIVTAAVQQAAAPLDRFRRWEITTRGDVSCTFDVAGMRADPRTESILAQLYRYENSNKLFHDKELAAVALTRDRLVELLR